MTTEGREEMLRRARDAVAKLTEAADIFQDFGVAMIGELLESTDNPTIEPAVIQAMAAAAIHVEAITKLLAAHKRSIALVLFQCGPQARGSLAERILEAVSVGEAEAAAASLERARRVRAQGPAGRSVEVPARTEARRAT